MNKENYIEIINEKIKNKNSKQIMINQINNYYDSKANYKKKKHRRIKIYLKRWLNIIMVYRG